MTIASFITRWQTSAAAERANYQLFLSELCDALDLPRPDPTGADEAANAYVFEKTVPLPHGTAGRIDLYRRGCFVLEAKQGSELHQPAPALSRQAEQQQRRRRRGTAPRGTAAWDTAMERAREQAQSYARALPAAEIAGGRPPFLLVVDVGQSIALYSEWSRSGGAYLPFPDSADYVMFWWDKAAKLARSGAIRRFGLITTNSLRQTFNRRVLERHLAAEPPLALRFASPTIPGWTAPMARPCASP